jgi:hypothetical protein
MVTQTTRTTSCISEGPPPRAYSIDNGRSLDGIPFYTAEGDPDWQPLAQLTPQSLVAPALSRQTLHRVAALPGSRLLRSLYLVAAIDLSSGRTVSEPDSVPSLRRYVGRPLSDIPQLQKVSRQSYLTPKDGSDGPWLLLGVSESGTKELLARAAALLLAAAHHPAAAVRLTAQQPLGDRSGDRFNAKGVGPDSSAARRRRDCRGTGSARAAALERAAPDGSVAPAPSWCESGRRPCG